jgi:hypothetical protein
MPIFVVARAMPMVRTTSPIRDFCTGEDMLDEGADFRLGLIDS